MLHRLITSNKIGSLILFPVILIVLQIPFFLENTETMARPLSVFISLFDNVSRDYFFLLKILRIAIIILSAYILQFTIDMVDIHKKRGLYTLYWFGLLNSFYLSQELDLSIPIANLFLILSLRRILSVYRKKKAYSIAFDSGFFLGVAVLFNPFYSLLIIFAWIAFTTLKTVNYREVIWVLSGVVAPLIILSFINYYFDKESQSLFTSLIWSPNLMFEVAKNNVSNIQGMTMIGSSITVLMLFVGMFKLLRISNSETTIRRKIFQILFVLTIILVIVQLFSKLNGLNVSTLSVLSVPLSIIMLHFFTGNRYKWIYISLFYIWFLLAVINSIIQIGL